MKDHSAGGITDAEAQRLHRATWPRRSSLPGFEFHTGVSYRNLLVYRGATAVRRRRPSRRTRFPRSRSSKYLPKGKGSEILRQIMDRSRELFADHEINDVRARNRA